jgi:hypothetical protein
MLRTWKLVIVASIPLALLIVAGCATRTDPQVDAEKPAQTSAQESEHAHKPGQHGGTVVEIGKDNYHAEAVFGKDGLVRLYMLGKDEARIEEVELQELSAYARAAGDTNAVKFTLKPAPRKDDSQGKTSVFEGMLPTELRDRPVDVIVTAIRIGGGRFRFAFSSAAQPGHAAMPKAVPSTKAKQLYLTPGGKYTEADIQANGRLTARQKYGDEMSEHDAHPKVGEKICPISQTKANPKFTWVVDGKTYEFCCTPCIDEFVRTAKAKPERIKAPDEYVQK